MFCTKCGTELTEGVKFCNNCGNQIIGTELTQTTTPSSFVSNRNGIISDIENARSFVLEAENYYQQAFSLQGSKNHFAEIGKILSDYYDPLRRIFIPLSCLKIMSKAKAASNEVENYLKADNINFSYKKVAKIIRILSYVISFMVFFIGGLMISTFEQIQIVLYLAVMITLAGNGIYFAALKKFEKSVQKVLEKMISDIDNNCSNLYDTAYATLTDYKRTCGVIPDKYLNSYSLNYMKDAIESCRADSLKEAINLFEDYNLKQEMIRQNDQHYQEIMQQQQAMFKQYRKDQIGNDIADAFILFSLAFN